MNLIQRIKRFFGISRRIGRPRIPIEKQLAIRGAPENITNGQLARTLHVSYATIQRYRRKIQGDRQRTPRTHRLRVSPKPMLDVSPGVQALPSHDS